ncbi:hypothetical protein O3P69_016496 [Scylla paramamosain]|uniref:Uncharacterized protein n=1 Tax=Scylla paramamosain TaxID=85552 RepID=A0AAW0TEN3_SCYPA
MDKRSRNIRMLHSLGAAAAAPPRPPPPRYTRPSPTLLLASPEGTAGVTDTFSIRSSTRWPQSVEAPRSRLWCDQSPECQ